jgi:Flp pilus assembly protein TadG
MILLASRSSRSAPSALGRRAAAAVEFAIVLPFLAVLVTGSFELARGIMVRQILTDAARKACRNGTLPNRANSDMTQDVNDVLTDNSVPTSAATITILVNGQAVDAITALQGDSISVKVAVPFNKVTWTPLFFFSNSSVESETLVMMRQR